MKYNIRKVFLAISFDWTESISSFLPKDSSKIMMKIFHGSTLPCCVLGDGIQGLVHAR